MSNVYVAQIFRLTPSEAYKRDPSVLTTAALDILTKVTGYKQSYSGPQVEGGVVIWVVLWETLDHHLAFTKDSKYSTLLDTIKPAFDGEPEVFYAVSSSDCTKSVIAPATEIVYIALKEGHTVDELVPLHKTLKDELDQSPGMRNQSWGTLHEKPNVFVGVIGWDSVEKHISATKRVVFTDVVTKITTIADVDLKHVHLKKD